MTEEKKHNKIILGAVWGSYVRIKTSRTIASPTPPQIQHSEPEGAHVQLHTSETTAQNCGFQEELSDMLASMFGRNWSEFKGRPSSDTLVLLFSLPTSVQWPISADMDHHSTPAPTCHQSCSCLRPVPARTQGYIRYNQRLRFFTLDYTSVWTTSI